MSIGTYVNVYEHWWSGIGTVNVYAKPQSYKTSFMQFDYDIIKSPLQ